MPTKWLALQFISGWFFIEEINTTNTGVEIFVNLWAWDKYLAFCPFTLRVTVDILFHSSRHVPTIVAPQLSMYLTATTLLVYWESMSLLFISYLFFVIATFIRSLETVPRQNIPLSKSFSNNVGKLKSCQNKAYSVCFLISLTNPKQLFPLAQALFFPFCQEKDQTHTDILFCFSIDTTTWNLICISCTAYKT